MRPMDMRYVVASALARWPAWQEFASLRHGRPFAELGMTETAISSFTRALQPRIREADTVVPSVCPYCAVGCGQLIYAKQGKIIDIEGNPASPINHPEVTRRFRQMQHGDAVISAITYGELHYGAERSQQRPRALESLGHLVSLLIVVPLPGEAATAYGEIRAALEARGEMIGGNDLWIAAHAKSAGLTLVTNNEREFKRVPGLKLQNWTSRRP